jgi:hypothetical protein
LGVCAASAQSAEKRLVIFTEAGHSDVKSEAHGFLWSSQVSTFSADYAIEALKLQLAPVITFIAALGSITFLFRLLVCSWWKVNHTMWSLEPSDRLCGIHSVTGQDSTSFNETLQYTAVHCIFL